MGQDDYLRFIMVKAWEILSSGPDLEFANDDLPNYSPQCRRLLFLSDQGWSNMPTSE